MSAVFDSQTKTARRVADPLTDKKLCPLGQLQFPSINTVIALGMFIGVDVAVIHGDQFIQVIKDLTVNILGNHKMTVIQNFISNVIGNHTEIIIGIRNTTIISNHITVNVGPRITNYTAVHVEVHCAPRSTSEPTSWFQWAFAKGLGCVVKVDLTVLKTEAVVQQVSAIMSKFELNAIKINPVGIDTKQAVSEMWLCGMENKLDALAMKIQPAAVAVGAVAGKLVGLITQLLTFGLNQVW